MGPCVAIQFFVKVTVLIGLLSLFGFLCKLRLDPTPDPDPDLPPDRRLAPGG